jgi:hypothetical protein
MSQSWNYLPVQHGFGPRCRHPDTQAIFTSVASFNVMFQEQLELGSGCERHRDLTRQL